MGMDEGYNVMLIIITVVITCLAVVANMYLIVHFQHPEDRNQAWFPKAIVLLALTVTELSILMLPLDVGNRNSCAEHVALTACSLTLPMRSLWYAVYMTMGLLVAVVIPFTIYYYEADSDAPPCSAGATRRCGCCSPTSSSAPPSAWRTG